MPVLVKEERTKDEEKGVWIIRRIWREDHPTTKQWEEIIEEPLEPQPKPLEPEPDKQDVIISLLMKIAGMSNIEEVETFIHKPKLKVEKI